MKKTYKVMSTLMIVLMLICVSTTVFANDILEQMTGKDNSVSGGSIGIIGNKILTFVTNIGMVLAVVLIAILGVKYMMGSTEEKAEYKKSMIPYLVGAVLVFGASAIGKAVVGFAQSLNV